MGCSVVAPKCDVSDDEELAYVLSHCGEDMPPVK